MRAELPHFLPHIQEFLLHQATRDQERVKNAKCECVGLVIIKHNNNHNTPHQHVKDNIYIDHCSLSWSGESDLEMEENK